MSSSDDEAKKPDDDLLNLSSTAKRTILTEVLPDEEDVNVKINQPIGPDRPSNDLLDPRQILDRSSPPRRYDSGLPTTQERRLLQIVTGVSNQTYSPIKQSRLTALSRHVVIM